MRRRGRRLFHQATLVLHEAPYLGSRVQEESGSKVVIARAA